MRRNTAFFVGGENEGPQEEKEQREKKEEKKKKKKKEKKEKRDGRWEMGMRGKLGEETKIKEI